MKWVLLAAGAAAVVIFGCVGIVALLFIAGAVSDDPTPTPQPLVKVTYRITTTSNQPVSLTYENATGNTEQTNITTRDAIWEQSFTTEPGAFLYVSAQLGDEATDISCEIEADGVVIEQSRSSGAFTIATCSGSAP